MTLVLIVDDELHAVLGLQSGIDWSKLDIEAVFMAHSLTIQLDIFENFYKHYRRLRESHQSLLKERFWKELIDLSVPPIPEIIAARLLEYDLLSLQHLRFVPILLRIERWHKTLTPRDEKILDYALRNAAEEKIAVKDRNAGVISLGKDRLMVFIPYSNNQQLKLIEKDCEAYLQACNQYLYCDLRCYVGEPSELHKLADMTERLMLMDRDNVVVVNKPILLWDPCKEQQGLERPDVNSWAELMKQGARARLEEEINQFFHALLQAKGVGASYLHAIYQDFLQMVFYVLQIKGLQANEVFAENLLMEKQESVLRSVYALEKWVRLVMELAMNQIHSTRGNLSVVDKAKRYVNERISDPGLSREELAGHVFLNPDYLTRLFKKETGLSISDYIQQQRIHYAKELLGTTEMSVTDVALAAGYSNLSYFSTIFKKVLLLNPNEYRKQIQKNKK